MRASQAPDDSPRAANARRRGKPHRTRRIPANAGPPLPGWEGKSPIRVTRKKELQKPHPSPTQRAAASRSHRRAETRRPDGRAKRCIEPRRPVKRSRTPHKRLNQNLRNIRNWKTFLAAPLVRPSAPRARHKHQTLYCARYALTPLQTASRQTRSYERRPIPAGMRRKIRESHPFFRSAYVPRLTPARTARRSCARSARRPPRRT